MSASISCVVTSYNNGPWLKQCVESVLAQTRRVDEIVIADDASTDGSQDLIRSLAEQRPEIRPVLREPMSAWPPTATWQSARREAN